MQQVLTGNRASLQFMEDEELHALSAHTLPNLKPLTDKLKALTKRYAEDAQKRVKAPSALS